MSLTASQRSPISSLYLCSIFSEAEKSPCAICAAASDSLRIGLTIERTKAKPEKTTIAIMPKPTAMMIALIEKAAVLSVEPFLESGQGTVGIHVDVSHCSATPLGMKVRAETELVQIDGRRLVFRVAAYDERGLIGEGRHERFIIDYAKFQAKADAK